MKQASEVTPEEVVKIIFVFNIPGWTDLTGDQVAMTQLGNGYVNRTFKVDRLTESNEGPKSLVFKMYGGCLPDDVADELNTPLANSLIFYEQSKHGWGPELYGLFEDGRIEEFVDCHTLTAEEAFTPELVTDVAKAFARFHSHKLPIRQVPTDLLEYIPSIEGLKDELRDWVASGEGLDNYPVDDLLRFPYQSEYEWIRPILMKAKKRTVLCTRDTNYQNRLVRNKDAAGADATQTLIIHLDSSCYTFRGYDLAGHFVYRMFNLAKKGNKLSGFPLPNEEERTAFMVAYLEEYSKLCDDFDSNSLDSIDNLTFEVDICLCAFVLSDLTFFIKFAKIMKMDPDMLTMVEPLFSLFQEVKRNFFVKYPSLAK